MQGCQASLTFEGAWSLGTSQRGKWVNEDQKSFPASNNYTWNFKNKAKARDCKFPQGPRQDLADKKGFPGPGTYESDIEHAYEHDKIKMGKKLPLKFENHNPAPNTYKPKLQKKSQPQFTMSYRHPKELISTTPAPNAYPNEENEKFLMSRTQDTWQRKTATSGFGTSQQRSNLNPTRRLDVKRKMMSTSQGPGPGEYIQHQGYQTQNGWSFGRGERSSFGGDGLPGPNHFDPKNQTSKSNGFSMGLKLNNGMKPYETCSPGPGNYQPREAQSHQGIAIGKGSTHGGIFDERLSSQVPGPNQYEQFYQPKQISHLKGGNSIGNADRPDLNIAAQQRVPGPGRYFEEDGTSLGGPSHIMAAKLKDRKKYNSMNPGPSQYNPYQDSTAPAISMTKGKRYDATKDKYANIGPNSYQNNNGNHVGSYKYSMGAGVRFGKQKKTYEPGPGSYDIQGTIGKIPEYLLLSKKKNSGLLDF